MSVERFARVWFRMCIPLRSHYRMCMTLHGYKCDRRGIIIWIKASCTSCNWHKCVWWGIIITPGSNDYTSAFNLLNWSKRKQVQDSKYRFLRIKQAWAVFGQVQLKRWMGFTSIKICCFQFVNQKKLVDLV